MTTRVLIVDDHAGFRASARRLLEAEGWEVVGEAPDGEAGVEAAARLAPDVVLVDVGLPGADGFDVAQRLTRVGDGRGPAVVLTSSRDLADLGRLVEACGACGFVAKHELSGRAVAALVG